LDIDALVKLRLTANSRRRLLAMLASLPIGGGLAGSIALEETAAKGRRRRKRHKGKGKGCKPASKTTICAGTCGEVKNPQTCGKSVDCGPCACTPACGPCQTCDTATLSCVASCEAGTEICVDGACRTCDVVCDSEDPVQCGVTLQAALAGSKATLHVCPGIYQGGFIIDRDVTVIGAGDGESPASDTILDGNDAFRVVRIGNNADNVTLERLRVRRGWILGDPGGGIINYNSAWTGATLALKQCTLIDNYAQTDTPPPGSGGALFSAGPTTLTDCLFADNIADSVGGAIFFFSNSGNDTLTIDGQTEIRGNTAFNGGGLFVKGGIVNIGVDCRITDNTAALGGGGGIYRDSGTVNLTGPDPSPIVVNNCAENCVGAVAKCAVAPVSCPAP
jgi:hypothetical protein